MLLFVSGILFGAASGRCYNLTATFGRLAGENRAPFVVSTYSYLFVTPFLAAFMWPWETPIKITVPIVWLGLLYALIPTAVGYLLYYQQLQESSKVSVIASMETMTATVFGVRVLDEKPPAALGCLGVIVVMASIVLIQQKSARNTCRKDNGLTKKYTPHCH